MLANDNLITRVIDALLAQSGWEWLAAGLGILYVVLAARESIWCWPAAFFSTLIYTVLFWEGQLPMQAFLNFYYLVMAVYGFTVWKKRSNAEDNIEIHTKSWRFHIAYVLVGSVLAVAIGYYLSTNVDNRLPYLDALVTVFSIMTTVLMARKVLENWIYWIVINSLAIALYWQTGFYVTIIMFMVYFVLALYGFKNWQKIKAKTNLNQV